LPSGLIVEKRVSK